MTSGYTRGAFTDPMFGGQATGTFIIPSGTYEEKAVWDWNDMRAEWLKELPSVPPKRKKPAHMSRSTWARSELKDMGFDNDVTLARMSAPLKDCKDALWILTDEFLEGLSIEQTETLISKVFMYYEGYDGP